MSPAKLPPTKLSPAKLSPAKLPSAKLPPGYELHGKIQDNGSGSTILHAREIKTGDSVVIKSLGAQHPTTRAIASFRHEYGILSAAKLPGVVPARAMEFHEGRPFLIMEDVGGVSLRARHSLSRSEFYSVARSLSSTLDDIHRERIIHKNINPDHVIVNPENLATYLVDFSIASILPRERQELTSADALEGDLAYISPEQTGRMNRSIDMRTDFYSLGITLYELLAGRLPFTATNALEWVHCHIAKTPLHLCVAQPDIPVSLGSVIMRLFEKSSRGPLPKRLWIDP